MTGELRRFVFGGLLGSHSIRDLQARGLLRDREVSGTDQRMHDLLAPAPESLRMSSFYMQRQYRMLYIFENLIREFIASRFEELDGPSWFEKRSTSSMKKAVDSRKKDEERNQWHPGRNKEPIYYLEFGHLNLLIKNHWEAFSDFFDSQTWIESRLEEAERSRNVIAHTNVLAAEEAQRLEMHVRDLLKQLA